MFKWQIDQVWITEFAFLPCGSTTTEQAVAEMGAYIQWLDAQDLVTRYAWFAARIQGVEPWAFVPPTCNPPLADFVTGTLTPFGRAYQSQP